MNRITLSDNRKMQVIREFNIEGKNYIYMIEENNVEDMLFAEKIDNRIRLIEDPVELDKCIYMINMLVARIED